MITVLVAKSAVAPPPVNAGHQVVSHLQPGIPLAFPEYDQTPVEVHIDGDSILIRDPYLVILSGDTEVAAFAAGTWVYAYKSAPAPVPAPDTAPRKAPAKKRAAAKQEASE